MRMLSNGLNWGGGSASGDGLGEENGRAGWSRKVEGA